MKRRLKLVGLLPALACLLTAAGVHAMQPLDDATLSGVQGRDGLSFDLAGFSMSGNARFTYYAPAPSTASLYLANPYVARSDDTTAGFADPYRLDITHGPTGLADIVNLSFPANANSLARWQTACDWGVDADGIAFDAGSTIWRDVVLQGGGLQWSTPRSGDGIAFGASLRMDIGNILLRPRGRDDITVANPPTVAEQMNASGVHLAAAAADGTLLTTPWRVADVVAQPGVLNAITDASGNARLHLGIDWPDANGAALGGLRIDNLSFRSDVTGNLDLGSSRIGSMQIQYLDIKVRP